MNFTVKMVIERTLNLSGDDCNGWAATEVIERGDGVWSQVCMHCPISRRMANISVAGHHYRI